MIPGLVAELVARARSLWGGVRRGDALHGEMDEEFRHHMELRAADLARAGLALAEARRRARLEFGSTERYKDEGRRSRGLRPFDELRVSWLDFKLGFRMLARYPGLTLVGGLAMAFAIWVGAGTFEFVRQVLSPSLPLPQGERIVGIQLWDAARGSAQPQMLHDFAAWREELRSVRDLGAFRTLQRNLIVATSDARPVEVAEISASAFRLTRVPPLLGRALTEADERPDAPLVAVIGHDVWRTRFGGDSTVVGRAVRLGRMPVTVVGVMPEGYAFPVSQSFWVPLRYSVLEQARGEGPGIRVFGRLAPGVSLDEAQAELTALGQRSAADFPQTHEHLRPRVMPYARSILNLSGTESLVIGSSNVALVMFLVLVCGNVALLLFARAATRETEIVVRTALGASRGRIVTQLFAEALVLGGLATLIGLSAAGFGLRWGYGVVEGELLNGARLPFWFAPRLSPATVLYAVLLTVLGAVIAGVMPALKVTRGLQSRLKAAGAGGGGLRFGGVWTAVIVSQIAVTMVVPVTTLATQVDAEQIRAMEADFPAGEFLSVRLNLDRETADGESADTSRAAVLARFRASRQELERRLRAEPGVVGVTVAERFPRMYHPHRLVEVDEGPKAPLHPQWPAYRVSSAAVAGDYFDVLGAPILAGRGFHAAEVESDPGVVLVNREFVDRVLGGHNPIGRRVRYLYHEEQEGGWAGREEPGPWLQIVGVVPNLGTAASPDPKKAAMYHPMRPDAAAPLHLAVRVRGDPAAFAPRLRAVAAAVDPALRLDRLVPLDELSEAELQFYAFWFRLLLVLSALALTLSLAGIYAVMSFTVARRTREIGIRIALGASARRVVLAIFRRPLVQIGAGVLAGGVLIAGLYLTASGGRMPLHRAGLLLGYTILMLGVCLLACIVPTRRALRVEPVEALREE